MFVPPVRQIPDQTDFENEKMKLKIRDFYVEFAQLTKLKNPEKNRLWF